ncbi:hypothetical protein V6N13_141481 [Hibiscus sabdariffa]|uniref:Glutathione S-transferase n=2 Tax=Hibiscus sabdariffa TaxID=183260 RepID=A0ABR2P512_9ROSI
MADEVVLLDFWASMFGIRVRIALAEKGLKYEYREEDLRNKSALLLQMNPVHKKIPVLIHNGKPISESLIQVQYMDEVWHGTAQLLCSLLILTRRPMLDSGLILLTRRNTINQSKTLLHGDGMQIYEMGTKIWKTKGEEQAMAKKEFMESLKLLEGELGDKAYFGGGNLGYLDIALLSYYCWFYAYEKFGDFSIEAECPKLIAWAKRCMQKESVAKSVPHQQKVYKFALHLKKIWN